MVIKMKKLTTFEKQLYRFGENFTKANEGWFIMDREAKKRRLIKRFIKRVFLGDKV